MKPNLTAILTVIIFFSLSVLRAQVNKEYSFTEPVKMSSNINTDAEDIMPMLAPDGNTLYFVRALYSLNTGSIDGGHDIWMSTKKNNEWTLATNKLDKLNNEENNGVIGIGKDGNTLYLLNAYEKVKITETRGICCSKKSGDHWEKPSFIPINSLSYKEGFQGFYMTPDEKILIISMQTDGSLGQEDLYVCLKNESNEWAVPLHLGSTINSVGFEMSPFLSSDLHTLYFSTDGMGGKGDADIFESTRLDDSWTNWSTPKNIETLNSSGYDAYFFLSNNNEVFFSSNRDGSYSDIYTSQLTEVIPEPEPEPEPEPVVTVPVVTVVPSTIEKIYFDVNSSYLTVDAKIKLKEIADKLKNEDGLKVEISAYADLRYDAKYNLWLTNKRADRTKEYLISQGVHASKIQAKGYGETNPVINCEDCTEEDHLKNRRTELKLIKN